VDLTAKQYLQGELERKLAAAREITREAESAGRPMTDDERKSVEDTLSDAASLKAQIKGMADNEALNEAIDRLGAVATPPTPVGDEQAMRQLGRRSSSLRSTRRCASGASAVRGLPDRSRSVVRRR